VPTHGSTTGRRGRGPGRPARISQRQIVAAALDLGLDAFTMQGIAGHLGVSTPALYSHVAGRGEVLALVSAALVERMQAFHSDAADWRGWLVDFAAEVREHLAPSASVLAADLRGPATTLRLGVGERGLQLLLDRGLTPVEAGRAVWLVFRLALTAGPRPAAALAGLVDDTGTVLGPAQAVGFPATRAVHDALVADGPHDTFDHDLGLVLDGIAARLDRPGDASDRGDRP
jgi:AcrR family transcriptional regulator